MRGYKAFHKGYICKNFQYEIGKEYILDGDLKMCKNGFHFCKNLIDVFAFYSFDREDIVLAEVEALGDIQQQEIKFCTDKIKILREVSWAEVDSSIKCRAFSVDGYNSGDYNSGKYNSGHRNIGHHNSGGGNSGDHNSGYCNSGNHNSGHSNSGDFNTGGYNSGNHNSGFFNSDNPTVRLFNKDSGMTFAELYKLKINWSDLEKSKEVIQNLPNYDAQIFFDVTGIDWRE